MKPSAVQAIGLQIYALALLAGLAGCSFDASANPKHCGKCKGPCFVGFCLASSSDGGGAGQGGGGEGSGDAAAADAGADAAAPESCDTQGETRFCFDGPQQAATVGLCKAGMQRCQNGVYGPCLGEVTPVDEQCNGQDDDCDGTADEDVAGGSCTADNAEGACKAGTLSCDKGVSRCQSMAEPAPESCNGQDDDCDGKTDEGTGSACYPDGAAGCVMSDGAWTCTGVCRAGTQACSGGKLGSCEGAVTPVATDPCTTSGTAADEDCDGKIDEDCACSSGQTQSCYSGPDGTLGVGACQDGTQTCDTTSNRFGACVGEVLPGAETCQNQGSDDDCDGTPDNVPTVGDTCIDSSKKGVCRTGSLQCKGTSAAAPICVTPDPAAKEACDGLDDDCDGKIDEDFSLQSDPANCGACGAACKDTQTCCSGRCSDTNSDASHCGMCSVSCGSGLDCCGGMCKDEQQDENNCGMCGMVCAKGSTCCGGTCVDLKADGDNCGMCGHGCASGLSCCSGMCIDTQTSNTNCGQCGHRCALLTGGTCPCNGGTCGGLCI